MGDVYDDVALALAEHRHGVVATYELAEHGMSPHHIEQLLSSRHWERVSRSVLRRRGSTRTDDQALASVVLEHGPNAYVSALSAGRLFGLSGCPMRPVSVVGTVATRRKRADVGYHRVRRVAPRWTTEVRGIPVVAPELCAMQLFACTRYESAERRVDSMWSTGRLSGRSVEVFLADMGRSGRNGIAGLRRYFEDRGVRYRPPDSGVEGRAIQVLRDTGIELRRQVDVGSVEAWTGRVDLMVVGHPVVVEIQSDTFHASLVNRERDRVRRADLEAAGFQWVELWETDVWARPWTLAPAVRVGIDRARRHRTPPVL